MANKFKVTLFFLIVINSQCLANHGLNALPDERQIAGFFAYILGVHVLSIFAFLRRLIWLRVVSGVLYAPVLVLPLLLSFFSPLAGVLIFTLVIAFFVFVIVRKRK